MNLQTDQVEQYLDAIELDTLGAASRERQRMLDELSSIDQMAVENLVSGFHIAAKPEAYLRALAMALVRAGRKQQCLIMD